MFISTQTFRGVSVLRPTLCIGALLVTGCGADGVASSQQSSEPGGAALGRTASIDVAAHAIVPRQANGASLEPALQAAYIHSAQLEAGAAYRVVRSGSDVRAVSEAQALATRFETARVVLSHAARATD